MHRIDWKALIRGGGRERERRGEEETGLETWAIWDRQTQPVIGEKGGGGGDCSHTKRPAGMNWSKERG